MKRSRRITTRINMNTGMLCKKGYWWYYKNKKNKPKVNKSADKKITKGPMDDFIIRKEKAVEDSKPMEIEDEDKEDEKVEQSQNQIVENNGHGDDNAENSGDEEYEQQENEDIPDEGKYKNGGSNVIQNYAQNSEEKEIGDNGINPNQLEEDDKIIGKGDIFNGDFFNLIKDDNNISIFSTKEKNSPFLNKNNGGNALFNSCGENGITSLVKSPFNLPDDNSIYKPISQRLWDKYISKEKLSGSDNKCGHFDFKHLFPQINIKNDITPWGINFNNINMQVKQPNAADNIFPPSTSFNIEYLGYKNDDNMKVLLPLIKTHKNGTDRSYSLALFFEKDDDSNDNKGKFHLLVQFEKSSRFQNHFYSLVDVVNDKFSIGSVAWRFCKTFELLKVEGTIRGRGHSANIIPNNTVLIKRSELSENSFKKVKVFNIYGDDCDKYVSWLSKYFKLLGMNSSVVQYDYNNKIFGVFNEDTRVVVLYYNNVSAKIPVVELNSFFSKKITKYNCGEGEFYNLVCNFVFAGESPLEEKYSVEEYKSIVTDIKLIKCSDINTWAIPETKLQLANILVAENN